MMDIPAILRSHSQWLSGAGGACADLSGANLSGANLSEADLRGADLGGTCLDPAAYPRRSTESEIEAAGLELIGGRVYGWRCAGSVYVSSDDYSEPGEYVAPIFSVDESTECHPGRYFASRAWLESQSDYRGKPLVRCWAHWHEICHAGDKWRARRLWSEGSQGEICGERRAA
jgi:hypothetical protein